MMARPDDAVAPDGLLAFYRRRSVLQRRRRLFLTLLGLVAFFYGAAFGFTTTYFLMQLAVPLVAAALLVIWLLPEAGRAPERLIERLFFAFVIALLCWPDYLALAIPGMPWITAIRLIGLPLALVFLIGLSQSQAYRQQLATVLDAAPAIWKLLTAFAIIALISIAFSKSFSTSMSKFVVAMLYWVMIFFVAAKVLSCARRMTWFGYLLWFIVIYVCLIGLQEARHQAVPWAGHIPSFLKIEDESVQRILSAKARAGSGKYRVQSKFTTPLGLAEYLAYATPFVLHIAATAKKPLIRVLAFATLPLIFQTLIGTDSRLGMIGFFLSLLLYLLAFAVLRWKRNSKSVFGPITVFAYPAIFVGFFVASFFVGRLRAMMWGDGSQQYSDQSRKDQAASGLAKIVSHPWGYGIGRGAETLGFTNGAGVLTIDTYYIQVGLEFGVVGFLVYYGMFGSAIWRSMRATLGQFDDDTGFIVPIAISLTNFFIIKSIFSQQENHPLVFMILGGAVALLYRMKQHPADHTPVTIAAAPVSPMALAQPAVFEPSG